MNYDLNDLRNIHFSESEKAALTERLQQAAEQSVPQHKPHRFLRRFALCTAAALAATTLMAAAVPVFRQTLREFFQTPGDYYALNRTQSQDGWNFVLNDCLADDSHIYMGIDVYAPDAQTLSLGEFGRSFRLEGNLTFYRPSENTSLPTDINGGGSFELLPDEDPTDNKLSFMYQEYTMYANQLSASDTFHLDIYQLNRTEFDISKPVDARHSEVPLFQSNQLTFSDLPIQPTQVLTLTPNVPVEAFGGTTTLTEIRISPMYAYVRVDGGSCYDSERHIPTHPELLIPGVAEKIKKGTILNTTNDYDVIVELKYKDGTVKLANGVGLGADCEARQKNAVSHSRRAGSETGIDSKTGQPNQKAPYLWVMSDFSQIQDLDQIQSVIVCGEEFPISTFQTSE